jgi:putative membrane protein insertion efficiency factor
MSAFATEVMLPAWRWLSTLPRRALLALVHAYRLLLKPWIGNSCRFEPSCSAYALEALQRHGAANGSLLTGARLLRCHPWCDGGLDPVPAHPPLRAHGLFSRLGLRADGGPPETRKLP